MPHITFNLDRKFPIENIFSRNLSTQLSKKRTILFCQIYGIDTHVVNHNYGPYWTEM